MEEKILITYLNDFIFCPISIYFHRLYDNYKSEIYTGESQLRGKNSHRTIDNNCYSTKKGIYQGISVYSEKYGLIGKIDLFNDNTKTLIEKKYQIKTIYDGYVFQIYAQYFCLKEMGYDVQKLKLYSISDNKSYDILLPEEDHVMFDKFENLIKDIKNFDIKDFHNNNDSKCDNCIYSNLCYSK